ncbi:transcriptional repressor [Leucothrix sargassi]|nr:transcriptional repressor [Leucothrix sargassi]
MSECQHNNEQEHNQAQHLDSVIAHAERHCKANGSRLTTKRKKILAGLVKSDKALSAYELIDALKEDSGEAIPAMSVYRILQFLEDEHLVHKLNLANKYVACAHISCDHAHSVPQFLICGKCNKVEEISIPKKTIDELQQNVEQAGFQLLTPQLEMNCVCNDC